MYVGDFLDAELAKKRGVRKEICETGLICLISGKLFVNYNNAESSPRTKPCAQRNLRDLH
jgi:hypothetical protein